MEKTIVELKEVHPFKIDQKKGIAACKITFLKNGQEHSFQKSYDLSNPVGIVNDILQTIKTRDEVLLDDPYEILESINVLLVKDEERVEEKMFNFFGKLKDQIKQAKSANQSKTYMGLYQKLQEHRLEF